MKKVLTTISLLTLFSCAQDDVESDIVINDFGSGERIELPANGIALHKTLDINSDGHPDYIIALEKHEKDGIYYMENAFYISIEKVTSYLQVANPFNPIVVADNSVDLRKVNDILIRHIVRYYDVHEVIDEVEDSNFQAFLSKTDELETVQPVGLKYIAVALNRNGITYYGWIEIELETSAVVLKTIAFSKTGNKIIKVGGV